MAKIHRLVECRDHHADPQRADVAAPTGAGALLSSLLFAVAVRRSVALADRGAGSHGDGVAELVNEVPVVGGQLGSRSRWLHGGPYRLFVADRCPNSPPVDGWSWPGARSRSASGPNWPIDPVCRSHQARRRPAPLRSNTRVAGGRDSGTSSAISASATVRRSRISRALHARSGSRSARS